MNFIRYTFTVSLCRILAGTFVVAFMVAAGLYTEGFTTLALLSFGAWLLFFIACMIGNYIKWQRYKRFKRYAAWGFAGLMLFALMMDRERKKDAVEK